MKKYTNIISYLTKEKGLKQSDIALKMDVAISQISKWKRGVKIPNDKEIFLMKLADIHWESFDSKSLSKWALTARTKANEKAWYKYFYKIMESSNRYSAAEELRPKDELIETILITLIEAGVDIPDKAINIDEAENSFLPTDILLRDYLENYLSLESWCCENLILTKPYMRHFFDILPRYTVYHCTLEGDKFRAFIDEPWNFQKYVNETVTRINEIKKQIEISTKYEGIDFNLEIFDGLTRESISHMFDENPDWMIRKNYDIVDGKLITAEDNNGVDINLSYGERKILKEIQETKSLLHKVLRKLERQ